MMVEQVQRYDGCDYFFDWRDRGVAQEVKQLALEMAIERGGQTMPVSDYDIDNAREQITDEKNKIARLSLEVRKLRARIIELEATTTTQENER